MPLFYLSFLTCTNKERSAERGVTLLINVLITYFFERIVHGIITYSGLHEQSVNVEFNDVSSHLLVFTIIFDIDGYFVY